MKLTHWLRPVHQKLRVEKIRLFFQTMFPNPLDTLLDLGGGLGVTGEFLNLYSYFRRVTILNICRINLPAVDNDTTIGLLVGNGCFMPFTKQSFDFVISNAVIEHLGSWQHKKTFANEIRRVAKKGYFVATPNKYFPIEPHTLLPFYQFMPITIQKILLKISVGYLSGYEPINLLSVREIQALFPEARVVKIGLRPFHTNLIAFWKRGVEI